ncbi:MAG: glutathione S-transferase, partial [Akkermansiaceae bacterium]|nr:glutathione S-transferase [Akkermansiaceae bacterium]
MKPLATDPTALSVMRERAPFTEHWTRRIDDASGVEGEWTGLDANPGALRALLALCGDTYLPFLRANAEAIAEDREMLS